MTRILLCDDHALVRAGFRALLAFVDDFEVVGEAANGRDALRLIRSLGPDVVLMDIAMPELNGLDATARATRESPGSRILIVSMHASESYVFEALNAGAAGYVLKNTDAAELERAIRTVTRGERYLAPAVSEYVVARLRRNDAQPDGEQLSSRQREVLQLIAEGRSTREIADRLHLSAKTVETHRAQLMERLKIRDVAGLTRYAIRVGLVDPGR